MENLIKDNLKPGDERFAACLALGMNQSQAYRNSHECKTVTPAQLNTRASKLAKKDSIRERVQALVNEAKVADLDSIGRAYKALLDDMAAAKEAKNWTALATFHRMRLQVLGMLTDNLTVTVEQSMSDDELAKRIAGDDPVLLAQLKRTMGNADDYDA